ncbi:MULTISPECIES: GNAT family N-acetyltransferase [unclassified Pseudomonas]|uniref:GNAT family N-acetyltransferase n=1 Tax=unclassified Pseudomonas TaxID=196821 RepID=UPI001A9F5F47|nr:MULTISPECIES: GNAT family N-acetyltransferase [unclassified Pseudomonas]MCE5993301.1 GNAT family N-acetyltransferase [Pseudomonas sp. KCA11]
MTSQLTVRLASNSDIGRLVDLDSIAKREPMRRAFIAQAVTAGQCWIAAEARDASMVLGYGVLDFSFFGHAFIPLIMVRDSQRRHGVGSAILRTLQSQCGAAKLFTSTNASNEPMKKLLGKFGFIESGYVENLDEGDPEIIFVKHYP